MSGPDPRPAPTLDLCFCDADVELDGADTSGWVASTQDELEVPLSEELGIPEVGDFTTEAWNIANADDRSFGLRKIAAAAALVPALLCADPVLAAPPTGAAIEAPKMSPSDAASPWSGLTERRVVLTLADGSSFRGTVLKVTRDRITCARDPDGLVFVVDAAQVVTAHVLRDAKNDGKPEPRGTGMIVLGSIATTIGGALAIGTLAAGASCGRADGYYYWGYDYCPWLTVPLGVVSAVNLSVGIPFIVTGVRRRKQHRAAEQAANAPQLSGFVAPGRQGVMAGVGVRF